MIFIVTIENKASGLAFRWFLFDDKQKRFQRVPLFLWKRKIIGLAFIQHIGFLIFYKGNIITTRSWILVDCILQALIIWIGLLANMPGNLFLFDLILWNKVCLSVNPWGLWTNIWENFKKLFILSYRFICSLIPGINNLSFPLPLSIPFKWLFLFYWWLIPAVLWVWRKEIDDLFSWLV